MLDAVCAESSPGPYVMEHNTTVTLLRAAWLLTSNHRAGLFVPAF